MIAQALYKVFCLAYIAPGVLNSFGVVTKKDVHAVTIGFLSLIKLGKLIAACRGENARPIRYPRSSHTARGSIDQKKLDRFTTRHHNHALRSHAPNLKNNREKQITPQNEDPTERKHHGCSNGSG